jgi:amino acid permease
MGGRSSSAKDNSGDFTPIPDRQADGISASGLGMHSLSEAPFVTPSEVDGVPTDSFLSTTVSICNALFGQNILAVPKSIAYAGLIPSIFLLILLCAVNFLCTVMTLKLSDAHHCDSFDDLGTAILGRAGAVSLGVFGIVLISVVVTGYIIIATRTVFSWFELAHKTIDQNKIYIRLPVVLIYMIIPVALQVPTRNVVLAFAGVVNLTLCVFYLVAVIIKWIINISRHVSTSAQITLATADPLGWCWGMSIYAGTFALPGLVLPKVKTFSRDLHQRCSAGFWALIIALVANTASGLVGYLMFGDHVKAVVLDSFDSHDGLLEAIKSSFFVVVTCAYPGIAQAVTDFWSGLMFHLTYDKLTPRQRALILFIGNIGPFIVGTCLPRAGPALAVAGAFGGLFMNLGFPPLMWVRNKLREKAKWEVILCWAWIFIATVAAVATTYKAIRMAIHNFQCPDCPD